MSRLWPPSTNSRSFLLASSSFVLAAACGDSPPMTPDDPLPDAPPGSVRTPLLGVVHSDYTSSSISIVDSSNGKLLRDDCVNSGTAQPAPALALSADLQFPSQIMLDPELLVIDRTNATLTWIDPATCKPARQMSVSTGFKANPAEAVAVSATKLYVLRSLRNEAPTPDAGDFDEGDDVLIVDPSTRMVTGRIGMGAYATPVTGVETLARPKRALRIGTTVYVSLEPSSQNYKQAGDGRIVIIDSTTDAVTGTIELPGLAGCGAIDHDADLDQLIVGCGGVYADGPNQPLRSGIVAIDLAATPPAIVGSLGADKFGGRAPAFHSNIVAFGATRGAVIVPGVFNGTPTDELWTFDITAKTSSRVATASKSFTFGLLAYDRSSKRLFVGDADEAQPRLRSYSFSDATLVELPALDSNPATGLPPRYLGWF